MTVVAMTRRKFSRLEVVVAVEEGQMAISRAAELLGMLACEKLRELPDCRVSRETRNRVWRRQRRLCGGRITESGLRYADAWLSENSEKPMSIIEVQQIRQPGRPA